MDNGLYYVAAFLSLAWIGSAVWRRRKERLLSENWWKSHYKRDGRRL